MIRRFGAGWAALASVLALTATVSFSSGVFADSETLANVFTDDVFRGCVVSALQTDNPLISETSTIDEAELEDLTSLACNGKDLTESQLVGLDQLIGLKILSLSNNKLSSVDLTKNIALERLILANNELTDLDLSNNTLLTYLDVRGNDDLELENLDISKTRLNTLTNENGIWEMVIPEEDPVSSNELTQESNDNQACSSWEIDDETISIFKGMLAAYGYDTSRYDATAVRLAASQTNMCDGMNVAEARTLMNAMGVTNLSDTELTQIAEMVTRAYNAINSGATLEELLTVLSDGAPLVPNTGVSTGEFNASMVAMSIGVVMVIAGVVFVVRYMLKRKEAMVTFRR